MSKLTRILEEVLLQLDKDPYYLSLNEIDKDFYFNNSILIELFNPDTSEYYKYTKKGKNMFLFTDKTDVQYYVYFNFMPLSKGSYYEFKVGYIKEDGSHTTNDPIDEKSAYDPMKSNTIAKIYRDECIPMFLEQDLAPDMKIFPVLMDPRRYDYALRMVRKFPVPNSEVTEDKPKSITIHLTEFAPRKEPEWNDNK